MTQNKALATVKQALGRGGALCKEFNRVRFSDDLDWKIEQAYALEQIAKSRQLQKCIPETIGRSMIDLAVMGLSLSPAMKEAYLIPYGPECTASPSYMGLVQIVLRAGVVTKVDTDVVREGDEFREFADREGKNFTHVKGNQRGEVTHAWVIFHLPNGEKKVEVMDQKALRGCRDAAAAKNGGEVPWVWKGAFAEEMYKKSVIRRGWKLLPKSRNPQVVAMMDAAERTDPMEFGVEQAKVVDLQHGIGTQELDALVEQMKEANYPEQGMDRQLQGLASGMGCANIRSVPIGRFDEAQQLMARGLEKWKERMSGTSAASDLKQESITAQEAAR
jgi:phage RecT family recombinase